jgi:hypothetical protein
VYVILVLIPSNMYAILLLISSHIWRN